MNRESAIRVRIAPSPTGFLHIGNARTFLFNWLFAQNKKGMLVLRIEDTDRERSRKEYEDDILEGLRWLGITHNEFYRQSERGEIYSKYLIRLIDDGKAFYCSHSIDDLERESASQREAKEPPRHICGDRDKKLQSGILRFKNDSSDAIRIHDIIRGDIQFDPRLLGDFSIAKSSSEPLYNFAVVVDDFEMNISHVIRGEDHISNTPKQILMQNAFRFQTPQWAHLPLLLGSDRSKLSKRHGAMTVSDYKQKGYLPEALVNFLVLLGWRPRAEKPGAREKEIFSREDLINEFSLERVQKSAAIAAFDKLDWLNREYIKLLNADELWIHAKPFFEQTSASGRGEDVLKKILFASRDRIYVFDELRQITESIFHIKQYSKELLLWRGKIQSQQAQTIIDSIINILSNIEPADFTKDGIEQALGPIIEKEGKGNVLWPFRASLSCAEVSFGPFELADILGKDESIKRLQHARELLLH